MSNQDGDGIGDALTRVFAPPAPPAPPPTRTLTEGVWRVEQDAWVGVDAHGAPKAKSHMGGHKAMAREASAETGAEAVADTGRTRAGLVAETAQLAAANRDLSHFVGSWALVDETGRREYLNALDLNFVVRNVALAMSTPPMHFVADEHATLHSRQGPLFGQMVQSMHPQQQHVTHVTDALTGNTTEITSVWEAAPSGDAVLCVRTCTLGKRDVCDQRSCVERDPTTGAPMRLRVETRLSVHPGAPVIEYDRLYHKMPPPA